MLRFAALFATVLMLVPALAAAQGAEPIGTVSEDETSVSRAFDSNPSVDAIFGIFAIGSIADTESQAMGTMTTLPPIIASGMSSTITESGATVGAPEPVPVTPIGDQSSATRVTFSVFGGVEGTLVILAVRQQTWVQVVLGMGLGTDEVLPQLEAMARRILPRWPSTDPVTVRPDGLRTGGIWTMMPLPEDVPAGFTVDPEVEEGPGPSTGETPDLPLLPTPTPPGGQGAPPPPASEAPAAELPGPTATPVPNPRVALPFDVTVEIFMPLDLATVNDDGTCSGSGLLDGLDAEGQITVQSGSGAVSSASAPVDGPGQVALDRDTGQEVCYFRATLTDVPARAQYTLLAGDTVLGRYSYDDLTETGSILVVIGEE